MASSPIAAGVGARDALQSVDQILEELDRLAATELDDAGFYAAVMDRLRSLGCSAAAIWIVDAEGTPEPAWHSQETAIPPDRSPLTASFQSAVRAALQAGQPRQIEKSPDGNGATVMGSARSIVAPWSPANIVHGALQVWFADKINPPPLGGYLQVLAAVGELVAMFFARQEQRRLRQRVDRQAQFDAFHRVIHESLDVQQVAYRIANDGRVLLDCDRLGVAVRRGNQYKILAISGADQVHRRAEAMQQLERLCRVVVRSGEPLWHSISSEGAAELPPQISDALSGYLDASPAVALAIIPLLLPGKNPAPPVGVLVMEQFDRPFESPARDQLPGIAEHCRLALTNAERVAAIPGNKLWLTIARPGVMSWWAWRTLAAVVLVAAVI